MHQSNKHALALAQRKLVCSTQNVFFFTKNMVYQNTLHPVVKFKDEFCFHHSQHSIYSLLPPSKLD